MRREPAIATWLLQLFCSGTESESAIGDLQEQYQAGSRGRFWFWRQSLGIVGHELKNRGVRKPLLRKHKSEVLGGLGLILLVATLSLAFILTAAELAGVLVGILVLAGFIYLFLKDGTGTPQPSDSEPLRVHPGISIQHIPVEGAVGLLFVIGTAFIFITGIPTIRYIVLFTIPLGIIGGALLLYWTRHHPNKYLGLGLKAKTPDRRRP